jgi:hypothetical protein
MSVATPTPPRHDETEALIEEAREIARHRRRRRFALVALAVAVLGAIAIWVGVAQSGTGPRSGARSPAIGVATPARAQLGEYWYTRSVRVDREPLPIVPRVMRAGQKPGPVPTVYFDVRTSTETWIGQDGTVRQRQLQLSRRFASPAGRRRWKASHQTLPGGIDGSDTIIAGDNLFPASPNTPSGEPGDPGDGLFSFTQLLALPLAPAALRARLERAEVALEHRDANAYVRPGPKHQQLVARLASRWAHQQDQLDTITALIESPIPDQLRLALVHAAAGLPEVKTAPNPPAGRIALTETVNGFPGQITVDANTGQLTSTSGNAFIGNTTVVAQGPTASARSLPQGVKPIPAEAQVPAPSGITISPASGTVNTGFEVYAPRPKDTAAVKPAPFPQAIIFGPTGPDCTFWASHAPIAFIPPGQPFTAKGQPVYRYRLLPSAIHRTTWCPGRYQLQVTPLTSTTGASQHLAGPSAAYVTVTR